MIKTNLSYYDFDWYFYSVSPYSPDHSCFSIWDTAYNTYASIDLLTRNLAIIETTFFVTFSRCTFALVVGALRHLRWMHAMLKTLQTLWELVSTLWILENQVHNYCLCRIELSITWYIPNSNPLHLLPKPLSIHPCLMYHHHLHQLTWKAPIASYLKVPHTYHSIPL